MPDNINIKKYICKECGKRAIYNLPNEKYGILCREHKLPLMIGVVNKFCIHKECNKQATFNFKEEKEPLYCGEHKLENMVNIKSKKCIYSGCNKQCNFGYENELALYCSDHKLENMVNVKGLKCYIEYCYKYPNFNYSYEKQGLYCSEHKLENMVNIKNKKCLHDSCNKIPSFNYKDQSIAFYCDKHKLENMVDVKHKLCSFENCEKRPSFNYPNKSNPIYCSNHKLKDMISLTSNICSYNGCTTISFYGFCGQKPLRCSKHIEKGMINRPRRRCSMKDCNNISLYGLTQPEHCQEHANQNEICLLVSECIECKRKDEIINKEGLCITYCSPNKLYTENKTREKVKEKNMLDYIYKNIKTDNILNFKIDKIIDKLCNLYRPDLMYDCGTHIVIVECDENQHKDRRFCSSYKDLSHYEKCRMQEIQNACGLSCIFIRWNPDCFRVNNKICKKYSIDKRLNTLKYFIEKCFMMKPQLDIEPVKYKYLFYDNYDENDTCFSSINEMDILLLS